MADLLQHLLAVGEVAGYVGGVLLVEGQQLLHLQGELVEVPVPEGSQPLDQVLGGDLIFGHKLAAKNVDLNRKVLADLAMNEPETFKKLVASVK